MARGRALGPGSLRKRDDAWYLDYTDEAGRRRRKLLGRDKRTAERVRSEIIHRRDLAIAGLGAEAGMDVRLRELADDYLEDLEQRCVRRHFKGTRTKLLRAIEGVGVELVRDLRPLHVIRHRQKLLDQGLTNRTANLDGDALRSMLKWSVEAGIIATNPLQGLRRLREGPGNKRALTDVEIARFLDAVGEDDAQCDVAAIDVRIPQRPLFETLLATGARWGELVKSTWGDVDLQRRVLVLRAENTKSRKERAIPLSDQLTRTLHDLRVLRESRFGRLSRADEPIFLSPNGDPQLWHTANVTRILNRCLAAAGIPKTTAEGKITVHALRHTCASRLARNGVPLVKAQRILGHSDPKLTAQVYTHLDAEDLRDAIETRPERPDEHAGASGA